MTKSKNLGVAPSALVLVAVFAALAACTNGTTEIQPVTASGDRYEVFGAEVWANIALDEMPERASKVQFDAGIRFLDEGAGMCLGGRLDTTRLVFKCDDPLIEGLEEGPWAKPSGYAPFGLRTVVVSWPPVDGWVQIQLDAELGSEEFSEYSKLRVSILRPLLVLPEECESIDTMTSRDTLTDWAEANPDKAAYGYMALDKDYESPSSTSLPSTIRVPDFGSNHVLGIKGDIEAARAELSAGGSEPCLVSVDYSRSELDAARDKVKALEGTDVYVIGADTVSTFNRVTVHVAAADLYTIRQITDVVDDPAILKITADGAVVD